MARTYSRNVLVTGLSLLVTAGTGLVLPSFLTHHLSVAMYGAWLLILQISSYVGLLDFGIQTAVAKYIAQHAAAGDTAGVNQHASVGTAITTMMGAAGLVISVALAALVPTLFRDVPAALLADVQRGVLLVGGSTAVLLACSPFAAFFRGLQRFAVPTFITLGNKLLYIVALVVLVNRHSSLTTMGIAVAVLNTLTGLVQLGAWRLMLPSIRLRRSLIQMPVVKEVLGYCAVLGIWMSGMLIIMGLDLTLVAHFDFPATAFYAVASSPITFLLLLLQAALNPLMPAVSALSVSRSAEAMGNLLSRTTRYIVLLLEMAGLPLILFGYLVLRLWVGPIYAEHSLQTLRLLVLAQIVRNLFGPYATMVIATGQQKQATFSGLGEAASNLLASVLLGRTYGALGVAMGTLIGSVVGVLIHLFVSLRRTEATFMVGRARLVREGWLRPAVAALPTLVLLPVLWKPAPNVYTTWLLLPWAAASLLLAWRYGLDAGDRTGLIERAARLAPGLARAVGRPV